MNPTRLARSDTADSYVVEGLPGTQHEYNFLVGASLVTGCLNDIPVRVMNPSPADIFLYKGTTLACIQEAEAIITIDPCENGDSDNKQRASRVCAIHQSIPSKRPSATAP